MGTVAIDVLPKSEINGTITDLVDSTIKDFGDSIIINQASGAGSTARLLINTGATGDTRVLNLDNRSAQTTDTLNLTQTGAATGIGNLIRAVDGASERLTLTALGVMTLGGNFIAVDATLSGNVVVTGTVTATDCFATSDARLKKDIKPFRPSLDKLKKLGSMIKSYKWKDTGKADIGLLAKDVEKVFPHLVTTDAKGYKAVNYQKLNLMMLQWI